MDSMLEPDDLTADFEELGTSMCHAFTPIPLNGAQPALKLRAEPPWVKGLSLLSLVSITVVHREDDGV